MQQPENCNLVIFGGSGDLTRRKLVPALYNLYCQDLMPQKFAILALGRKIFSDDAFQERMIAGIKEFTKVESGKEKCLSEFIQNVHYQNIDVSEPEHFAKLKERLKSIDLKKQIDGKYLFYLAMPPGTFVQIANNLKKQGLNKQKNDNDWKRIILEKPFGHDLNSARKLNQELLKIFSEDQIYRIDHYLGKETVQNILAFRFANVIFESLWNQKYIHHIEITASEKIGVEERGGYYDQAGALRDMVQNHLLQLAAVIAMEPPSHFESNAIHNEKAKIFQALRPYTQKEIQSKIIRGQYIESKIRGEQVGGYRNESNVADNSKTETFVAMKFYIDNWRWGGVPFYIRTGKRLPTRVTEVVVHFKKIPHIMFPENSQESIHDNKLILRIQPDEGILLKFGMKLPGAKFIIKNVEMDFHYSDLSDNQIPEAYERLLLDAILGNSTLYARADEVEASWEFITPILNTWETDPKIPVYGYPAGTWGPKEARDLFDDPDEDWRYPCKNLTGADNYCEL